MSFFMTCLILFRPEPNWFLNIFLYGQKYFDCIQWKWIKKNYFIYVRINVPIIIALITVSIVVLSDLLQMSADQDNLQNISNLSAYLIYGSRSFTFRYLWLGIPRLLFIFLFLVLLSYFCPTGLKCWFENLKAY